MEPAAGGRYSAGAAGAPGSRGPCGVDRVRQRIQLAPGPSDGASARNGARRPERAAWPFRADAPSLGPGASWIRWRTRSTPQGPRLPGAPAAPAEYRPPAAGSIAPLARPTFRPCPDKAVVALP